MLVKHFYVSYFLLSALIPRLLSSLWIQGNLTNEPVLTAHQFNSINRVEKPLKNMNLLIESRKQKTPIIYFPNIQQNVLSLKNFMLPWALWELDSTFFPFLLTYPSLDSHSSTLLATPLLVLKFQIHAAPSIRPPLSPLQLPNPSLLSFINSPLNSFPSGLLSRAFYQTRQVS